MTRYTQYHAWLLSGSIALTVTACVLSRCCHEWTDYTVCNTAITRKRLWVVHLLAGVCIAPTALLIATSTDQDTGDYARSEPPKCSSPNYYTPPKRGASSLPRATKLQARANARAATNGNCSDHGMAFLCLPHALLHRQGRVVRRGIPRAYPGAAQRAAGARIRVRCAGERAPQPRHLRRGQYQRQAHLPPL